MHSPLNLQKGKPAQQIHIMKLLGGLLGPKSKLPA